MKQEWDSKLFDYADKKELESLKKSNSIIESYRKKYKQKVINDIKKGNIKGNSYYIDSYLIMEISKSQFNEFDDINVMMFEDISSNYYKKATEIIENTIDEKVELDYDKKKISDYLLMFIVADGINYSYKEEISRRMEYYNSQITNSMMATINKKLSTLSHEYVSKNYKDMVSASVNMNSDDVSGTIRTQKKQLGNFVDNVMIFIATQSMLQAYKDYGINKVIRIAEIDDRTCKLCTALDRKIYSIDKAPHIPTHLSCRCMYLPIIE